MIKLTKLSFYVILLVFIACNEKEENNSSQISNDLVSLRYDTLSGTFDITDKADANASVHQAVFTINQYVSSRNGAVSRVEVEHLDGNHVLIVTNQLAGKPTLLFKAELQDNNAYLDLTVGITNSTDRDMRLMNFTIKGEIFEDMADMSELNILDGNTGAENTKITDTTDFECHNNALITFKSNDKRYSLVAGGLTYRDFEKKIRIKDHKQLEMYAYDPVGKLVPSGETYWADNDRFYVDVVSSDPFQSLENYGLSLCYAQGINLNQYTFPTVCMWYVNYEFYGGKTGVNDSPGAVEEMRKIKKSGFLDFSGTAAVRLVPDYYGYNNQQGWWDDKHWAAYGSPEHTPVIGGLLKEPYETLSKFGEAITELGGLPLLYFQTNWRSEDYAAQHPDQMLFNKKYARRDDPHSLEEIVPKMHEAYHPPCKYRNEDYYGYDFTDQNFVKHMEEVYTRMKQAKFAGLMFDYPWSGWADKGGMDDSTSTAAAAYRKIFELAKRGLGERSWIHERCTERPSDVALGLVESQRTEHDNDWLTPESVTRSGLRWYKNRVVVSYDADAKNLLTDSKDELHKILTMSYVTSGRLLLGVSFGAMSKETIHDLSRIYPFHSKAQSARPIDAFIREIPYFYDFKVNPDWHQLTIFNVDAKKEKDINISLSGEPADGNLGLNPKAEYYVYDFWNDSFVGKLSGSHELEQTLRADEARMLSIHKALAYPQVISVDRHLMQGFESLMETPKWRKNKLKGKSRVVRNDPYTITIALNGKSLERCEIAGIDATCSIDNSLSDSGIAKLTILAKNNAELEWVLTFDQR